jgi:hypothetical protein
LQFAFTKMTMTSKIQRLSYCPCTINLIFIFNKKRKKKKKKERKKEDGLEIGGSNHKLACSKIYSCYPKFS